VAADIAEARRSQQGIDDGMKKGVRVAVAAEPSGAVDADAAQHQRTRLVKGVNIVADPDAHG
jgi:hypothetical protein